MAKTDQDAMRLGAQMAITVGKALALVDMLLKEHPRAFTPEKFLLHVRRELGRLSEFEPSERQAEILDGIAQLMLEQIR